MQLSEYQNAVLQSISTNYLSWYKIEQRLSNMSINAREDLINILSELSILGLVEEDEANRGTYRITDFGQLTINDATD